MVNYFLKLMFLLKLLQYGVKSSSGLEENHFGLKIISYIYIYIYIYILYIY